MTDLCSLLKWDKGGHHKCKGKPISEADLHSNPQFWLGCESHYYSCDFAFFEAFGDMCPGSLEEQQKEATENCPLHYLWEEMKVKVSPALTLAFALIQQENKKCNALLGRSKL